MTTRKIFCCECQMLVEARLTDGREIYRHRPDLHHLPFWKCDTCKNHVGTHHKLSSRIKPLGCIPNKEISNARKHIHALIDPHWRDQKQAKKKRSKIYKELSNRLGYEYHTGEIRTIEEARRVYRKAKAIVSK